VANSRRPMGALEAEVLDVLWRADGPLTPAEVLAQLGDDLAYTTVMTTLTRLWQKELAERVKAGRAYAYRPTVTEAQFAASRMQVELSKSSDRLATMSQFVGGLDAADVQRLLELLEQSDQ